MSSIFYLYSSGHWFNVYSPFIRCKAYFTIYNLLTISKMYGLVEFYIKFKTKPGEQIYLVGNTDTLGQW